MKYTERRRDIGERLRHARRANHLSQEDVAGEIGVSQQTVANWEGGRSLPALEMLADLCALYGSSPTRIVFGQDCSGGLMGSNVVRFDACPPEGRAHCRFFGRLVEAN